MKFTRSALVSLAVGVLALALGGCGQAVPTPRPSSPATPSPTASPTHVSVATLTHDRWSPIPSAPFAARYGEVGVWDGKELIIWGGTSIAKPQKQLANGAAYSPSTRQWTTLPPSPLSGRNNAAAVWTGTDLFLWSGTTTHFLHGDTDGALYNPAHHTWSILPPSPLPSGEDASATWTGTTVVVVEDVPSAKSQDPFSISISHVAAATYTPTTHTWHVLPSLDSSPGHSIVQTEALEDAGQFTLFDDWQDIVSTSNSVSIPNSGVDVETLDSTTGHWTLQSSHSFRTASVGSQPPSILAIPISTSDGVYFPPISQCGFGMSCPAPFGLPPPPGFLYVPSQHKWSSVPGTPSSAGGPVTVWSGAAAISVSRSNALTPRQGPTCPPTGQCSDMTTPAGTTAAYTPHTHTWTILARDPDTVDLSIAVWCGDRVIIFGDVAPVANTVPAQATGIQLGP